MKSPMSYEQLVEECKRLRLKSEKAEAEFFAFLMVAEREHAEVWQGGGCADFQQFLASNHLADGRRYRFFAIGVDRVGLDTAIAHGAHWTIQAGMLPDPSPKVLRDFTERARAFVEMEHTAPAEQTVRTWAAEAVASGRDPKRVQQVSELHRLRAENQELRAKLRAAEKRAADAEAKLAKLAKPSKKTEARA
jgi:hypothetical protein